MKQNQKIKFALMSVADIKNYGDTLFPFVARKKLLKYFPSAEFRFFTPTECKLENEKFYKFSIENLSEYKPDVILTIGGEVIHKYNNIVWREMYHDAVEKPSDVFFGWLDYPAKYKAWFSVGALDLSLPQDEEITDDELSKLNHIALRGILSKKILEKREMMNVNRNLDIVPDIGWTFGKYFKNIFFNLFNMSFKYRFPFIVNQYIVFNINWTSIPREIIEDTLMKLNNFSKKKKVKVVILNVISTYKKIDYNIEDFIKSNKNFIYLNNCSLSEMGALLCGCRFYIGSSLHCAMTTLSSCKPAALIHSAPLTKFQDMFGHMMRTDLFSNNWNEFQGLLYKLNKEKRKEKATRKIYVNFMQKAFDYKFENMVVAIKNNKRG